MLAAAGTHAPGAARTTLSTRAALAHHLHESTERHDDSDERYRAIERSKHPTINGHMCLVGADECRDAGKEEDETDDSTHSLAEAATGPAFAAAGATRTAGHK